MELKEILKKLIKKGDFVHTDGNLCDNFLEVAALPTNPQWVDALLDTIVPVFKKLKPDYIASSEGITVATATHISRELGMQLLLIPRGEHPYTQTIRGEFEKNKSVVVFATLVNNPSGIMHACEILKKNGLNIKAAIALINRGRDLDGFFSSQEIEFVSIYDYPTEDDAEIEESKKYAEMFK